LAPSIGRSRQTWEQFSLSRECRPSGGNARRTLLYRIVAQHYPAFVELLAGQDRPLPDYVQQEFEAYLKCGRLQHGVLRVRCDTCHAEHRAHDLGAAGEEKAQGIGNAQHPLPHRLLGKHFVDEERRALGHAPRAATGTEPTPLAAEGHQVLPTRRTWLERGDDRAIVACVASACDAAGHRRAGQLQRVKVPLDCGPSKCYRQAQIGSVREVRAQAQALQ
jgi:hypothetical protein